MGILLMNLDNGLVISDFIDVTRKIPTNSKTKGEMRRKVVRQLAENGHALSGDTDGRVIQRHVDQGEYHASRDY